MLFTQFEFIPFFLLVFTVYWATKGAFTRKAWLLLSSYAFYAFWDLRFLALIFASTSIDYFVGRKLFRSTDPKVRKYLLLLSLSSNLGILFFFKYFNFFIESSNSLFEFIGISVATRTLEIILPVGISFFTFQSMSYTIDIYRRKLSPVENPVDFFLFVSFFPQLVAGPIVRSSEFLPQLKTNRRWHNVEFRNHLFLFVTGFFKKAVVSDTLSKLADAVFQNPAIYHPISLLLAVFCFTVVIYCDFSGYSDMAIACAGLLGFQLPRNFDFPYFTTNITNFWRKWHISLSSWLKDYLFIPLGGTDSRILYYYRNILLTMLLGGLWHGASWSFILWGALHGIALVIQKHWQKVTSLPKSHLLNFISCIFTFSFVTLLWSMFRIPTLTEWFAFWKCVFQNNYVVDPFPRMHTFILLATLVVMHWFQWITKTKLFLPKTTPSWQIGAIFGALVYCVLFFKSLNTEAFIYFQF